MAAVVVVVAAEEEVVVVEEEVVVKLLMFQSKWKGKDHCDIAQGMKRIAPHKNRAVARSNFQQVRNCKLRHDPFEYLVRTGYFHNMLQHSRLRTKLPILPEYSDRNHLDTIPY